MSRELTGAEARAALETAERARLQVIAEIGVPSWYWYGLAVGWVLLGLVTDLADPWVALMATFVFGAVHAAVAQRAVGRRARTGQLSVRADVAGQHLPLLVLGGVADLGLFTVVAGWLISADGAAHPVTIASVIVAVMIALGGPQAMVWARRRAARSSYVP